MADAQERAPTQHAHKKTLIVLGVLGVLIAAERVANWAEQREDEEARRMAALQGQAAQEAREAEAVAKRQEMVATAAEALRGIGSRFGAIEADVARLEEDVTRSRWGSARQRTDALAPTFDPIRGVPMPQSIPGASKQEQEAFASVRALVERFEQQRAAVQRKEDEVFEAYFEVFYDHLRRGDTDEAAERRMMAKLARRLRVSVEYIDDLSIARADEVQRRVQAGGRKQAR